eukprot:g122.t1
MQVRLRKNENMNVCEDCNVPIRWSSATKVPSSACTGRLGVVSRRCVDLDTGDVWSVEDLHLPRLAGGINVCTLLHAEMRRLRDLQRVLDGGVSGTHGQCKAAPCTRRAIGVRVADTDDGDGDDTLTASLFTELPGGGAFTLAQLLRGTGPLPLAAVRTFARRLLRVLRTLHAAGGCVTPAPAPLHGGRHSDVSPSGASGSQSTAAHVTAAADDNPALSFMSGAAPSSLTLRAGGALCLGVPWGQAVRRLVEIHHALQRSSGIDGGGQEHEFVQTDVADQEARARDLRAACFSILAMAVAPPPGAGLRTDADTDTSSVSPSHADTDIGANSADLSETSDTMLLPGRAREYADAAWDGASHVGSQQEECWTGDGAMAAVREALSRHYTLGTGVDVASEARAGAGDVTKNDVLLSSFVALLQDCLAPNASADGLLRHPFCVGCGSSGGLTQLSRHMKATTPTASPSARAHASSRPLDLGIGAQKRSRARKLFAHRQRISDVINRLDRAQYDDKA